jgi:PAS domain S-box-containing protein
VSDAELSKLRAELDRTRAQLEALETKIAANDSIVGQLRSSEELTRRLIEAMPGGIVHVTATGQIRTANAEAQRILGLSYDELSERYVADFEPHTIFEDGSACPVEDYPVTRALVTGEAQPRVTIGVQRPDGRISWAVFTAVPIKDEHGTTTGAVVTFIDITQQRQLARELREALKMEAIGRLAGGIAHDFNNVLTVVVGNTAHVRDTIAPGHPSVVDLDHVLHAARRASSLTGQLLAFASRQVLAPRVLALDSLVDETASLLRRLIGEHIELEVQHERPVSPVKVDRGQFEQVIINLALNARDAMPEGGRLTISVRNGPDGLVELRVVDTGRGIDADSLEHVFEPFFTTKDAGEGTGLGLSTCYGIARQAGGSIEVENTDEHGTTFCVRVPRSSGDERHESGERPTVQGHRGEETVLLIEDDADVRRVVERGLGRYGYRVIVASGGEQALQLLREGAAAVDVLVSDVVMPEINGIRVAREARLLRPELPIILVSGYPDGIREAEALEGPAQSFLRKPFEPATLSAVIREMLDRSAAADRV